MFSGHFGQPHISPNNNTPKIRRKPRQPINGRLEILFMSTQINNTNNLSTILNNFLPIFIFILIKPLGYNLFPFGIESHDLLCNGTSSSCLHLMFIIKYTISCSTITIIWHTLCQHCYQCWFTGIYVTDYTQFYVFCVLGLHLFIIQYFECVWLFIWLT